MFCNKCGSQLGENDRFCTKCGNKIKVLNETENNKADDVNNSQETQEKKAGGKVLIIVLAVLILTILIGGVAFYFNSVRDRDENIIEDDDEMESEDIEESDEDAEDESDKKESSNKLDELLQKDKKTAQELVNTMDDVALAEFVKVIYNMSQSLNYTDTFFSNAVNSTDYIGKFYDVTLDTDGLYKYIVSVEDAQKLLKDSGIEGDVDNIYLIKGDKNQTIEELSYSDGGFVARDSENVYFQHHDVDYGVGMPEVYSVLVLDDDNILVKCRQVDSYYTRQWVHNIELVLTSNPDSIWGGLSYVSTQSYDEEYYIWGEASDRVYDISELEWSDFSEEECRIARNEIFARKGRKFTTDEMRSYFESQPWYEGTIEKLEYEDLSDIEKKNIQVLDEYKSIKGYK